MISFLIRIFGNVMILKFRFKKQKLEKRKLLTNQQRKESFFVFGVNFLFILLSVFIFIRICKIILKDVVF